MQNRGEVGRRGYRLSDEADGGQTGTTAGVRQNRGASMGPPGRVRQHGPGHRACGDPTGFIDNPTQHGSDHVRNSHVLFAQPDRSLVDAPYGVGFMARRCDASGALSVAAGEKPGRQFETDT